MKNSEFKVGDVFGDIINKGTISPEQRTKLKKFFSENIVVSNIKINFNFFEPKQKKTTDIEPSAPPYYE